MSRKLSCKEALEIFNEDKDHEFRPLDWGPTGEHLMKLLDEIIQFLYFNK